MLRGALAIVIFAGVTVAAGFGAADLRIDTSPKIAFREDDPSFARYRRFIKEFGGDELVVVAYRVPAEWGDAFSPQNIRLLDEITTRLARVDGVLDAMSLATAVRFVARNRRVRLAKLFNRKDGRIVIPPPDELAKLRRYVLENPILSGNIISRDGKAVAVVCRVETRPEQPNFKRHIKRSVEEALKDAPKNITFYIAGPPIADVTLEDCILRDLVVFLPLLVAILAGVLFYVFRDIRAVVLPLVTIGASVVWTGGLIKVISGAITLATVAVPPIVLAVGVALVVHFLSNYRERRETLERAEAVRAARRNIAVPCLLAGLTTAMGFLSLSIVDVPAVREMGFYCAFAVMAGVVVTLVFVPEIVLLWKRRVRSHQHMAIRRFLGLFARNRAWRLFMWGVVTVGLVMASLGIPKIRVETSLLEYFKPGDPMRVAHEFVAKNFGGVATVNILITDRKGVMRVETIRKVARLREWLCRQSEVGQVLSVAEVLACMNAALLGEKKAVVEPAEPLLAQHSQALKRFRLHKGRGRRKGGALAALISEDFKTLRISVRLKEWSSRVLRPFMARLKQQVAQIFPQEEGRRTEIVGTSVLFLQVASKLVNGEKQGLLVAFFAVLATVLISLRSFKLAAVTMIPTSLPIFAALGLMGFLNVPVNVSTSMVPSVALGILVDNAIHYVWRSRREKQKGARDATVAALMSVGRPLTFNAVIISAGFAVLIGSSFRTNRFLGAFTVVALLFGLVCTFLLLPPLVRMCLKEEKPAQKHPSNHPPQDGES